ncbi:MAG: corrinoid protein [Acidobacteria bacterium]|nr:corrinoid protein [Acidobacteriota bacterium]
MADLETLRQAIIDGDAKTAGAVAREAVAAEMDALTVIQQYMVPAMDEVGRRYECEEFFVPELLLSARAMKAALEPIRPLLAASGAKPAGKVVIGTVKGDLHDIGKNLVASLLEGGGFEVIDLGADVSPQKFIDAVQSTGANIVALSALLTVTMPSIKMTIEALKAAGVRDKVKVMVGGAPLTQQFADQVGADAYSENATAAVTAARRLVAAG